MTTPHDTTNRKPDDGATVLVLGATGKTGRRIAERLEAAGTRVRRGSRATARPFDWHDEATWDACLAGVQAAYISYAPDLALPGATDAIASLVDKAGRHGLERLVLLSGRGEDEAQACERIVQRSGLQWTIVRASWFNQNFSEGAFAAMVQAGRITLPDVTTPEPFVDADDIADVAAAALTQPGHAGEVYELTGPRLLTLAEVAAEIGAATGRRIQHAPVPHADFVQGITRSGAPKDVVWMLDYLFATVLDGRNAQVCDGVTRALGRPAKDFSVFAREVAAGGLWRVAA
ncbi:NAD(P)H-binding protein [Comamonadaceae bacterium G21597-S1]|nr:NAD(P)H-binding protein [Comamonadaceae bacterium G21597-S1]